MHAHNGRILQKQVEGLHVFTWRNISIPLVEEIEINKHNIESESEQTPFYIQLTPFYIQLTLELIYKGLVLVALIFWDWCANPYFLKPTVWVTLFIISRRTLGCIKFSYKLGLFSQLAEYWVCCFLLFSAEDIQSQSKMLPLIAYYSCSSCSHRCKPSSCLCVGY